MALIRLDILPANAVTGQKLDLPNLNELTADDPFYGEDIQLVRKQQGVIDIVKRMATLFGTRRAVWVGVDVNGNHFPADGLVALRCPPFYPANNLHQSQLIQDSTTPPGFDPNA